MEMERTKKRRKTNRFDRTRYYTFQSYMNHHLKLAALSLILGSPAAKADQPGTAVPGLAAAVDKASAESLYQTARDLLKAGGGDDEARKGFTLMLEAAGQGYLPAVAGVGYLYTSGLGVAKDNVEAAKWFRAAADQEHAISRYNLGKLLVADEIPLPAGSTDRAVQHTEGVEWIRKAANQGQIEAKSDYGIILMRGDFGVKPDPAAAAPYLIAAAEAGNSEAMNTLGTMYQLGNGVPFDLGAAERSFRKAAMMGHVKAQANLGEHLDPSSPDSSKRVEALAWLYLAEQAKDPVAMKILQNKAAVISPGDEAAGRKKAAEFRREIRSLKK